MQPQAAPRHHNCNRRAVDIHIPAVEKYAYCLCLHVKPTTIFIAVVKIIRTLTYASLVLNSEFATPDSDDSSMYLKQKSTAAALTILMLIITASIAAVGIYAVISGRAALLMPLCAIMLCDFLFTLPHVYHRDLDPPLAEGVYTFKEYSSNSPTHGNSRYAFFVLSTLHLMVRIYFLCVIWKCYRYLRLRELILPLRIAAEIYPHVGQVGPHPIVRVLGGDSGDLTSVASIAPPPYDAIITSMKTQPPNYEEAMKNAAVIGSYPESLIANPPSPQEQQPDSLEHQNQTPAPSAQMDDNRNLEQPGSHVVIQTTIDSEHLSSNVPKTDQK